MSKIYIGLDGDSIGRVIEEYLITNQIDNLKGFSNLIVEALEMIKVEAEEKNGDIIFCSGDSILFSGDFTLEFAEQARLIFNNNTKRTASVGVGYTTAETYLGLKLAKSRGGNQVVFYEMTNKT